MSYGFWVPPLGPDGSVAEPCTRDNFLGKAMTCAKEYFLGWAPGDQREASARAAEAAIHTASVLAQTGIVGDTFRVNITGHANLVPGSPTENWSNDYCVINIQAVKVPA